MGCGGSKLDPASDMIPARLRPLLRRRYEELNRRRNKGNLKDSTLSNKELLKAGGSDEDGSNSQDPDYDRKSASSDQEDSLKVAPDLEPSNDKIIKVIEVDKASVGKTLMAVPPETATNPEFAEPCVHVAQKKPVEESPAPATESDKLRKERSSKENDAEMATAVVEVVEITEQEAEDTEDDEERGLRFSTCPGSPSFRVFLSDSLPYAKEDNESDDEKDDDMDKVLQRNDSGETKISQREDSGENVESSNSNEGSVTKSKKKEEKGKRGRGFRKVMLIPKGRPGAVKNLLHVNMKSCYNPACSGGHDNASLLSQKVA